MNAQQPDLLDLAARAPVAPTSREQFDRIRTHLPLRDLLMVAHVDDYCRATGYPNVTGLELAEWLGRAVTSVRPALTRAHKAGWLATKARRPSRHPLEHPCAPYQHAVPRQAIDRAITAAREATKRVKIAAGV